MSNGAKVTTLDTNSNNAIEVRDLTKHYGRPGKGVLAVDHISFDVRQGEVFGFLGPNGAGKTTTQRMLTTLLEPTEGRIVINGHDLARDAYPVKRQMGLVPFTTMDALALVQLILSIAFLRRARTETKAAEERIAALKGDL